MTRQQRALNREAKRRRREVQRDLAQVGALMAQQLGLARTSKGRWVDPQSGAGAEETLAATAALDVLITAAAAGHLDDLAEPGDLAALKVLAKAREFGGLDNLIEAYSNGTASADVCELVLALAASNSPRPQPSSG